MHYNPVKPFEVWNAHTCRLDYIESSVSWTVVHMKTVRNS